MEQINKQFDGDLAAFQKRSILEKKYKDSQLQIEKDNSRCKSLCGYYKQSCIVFERFLGLNNENDCNRSSCRETFSKSDHFDTEDDQFYHDIQRRKELIKCGEYIDCSNSDGNSNILDDKEEIVSQIGDHKDIEYGEPYRNTSLLPKLLLKRMSCSTVNKSMQTSPKMHGNISEIAYEETLEESVNYDVMSSYNADVSGNGIYQSSYSCLSNPDIENSLYPASLVDTTENESAYEIQTSLRRDSEHLSHRLKDAVTQVWENKIDTSREYLTNCIRSETSEMVKENVDKRRIEREEAIGEPAATEDLSVDGTHDASSIPSISFLASTDSFGDINISDKIETCIKEKESLMFSNDDKAGNESSISQSLGTGSPASVLTVDKTFSQQVDVTDDDLIQGEYETCNASIGCNTEKEDQITEENICNNQATSERKEIPLNEKVSPNCKSETEGQENKKQQEENNLQTNSSNDSSIEKTEEKFVIAEPVNDLGETIHVEEETTARNNGEEKFKLKIQRKRRRRQVLNMPRYKSKRKNLKQIECLAEMIKERESQCKSKEHKVSSTEFRQEPLSCSIKRTKTAARRKCYRTGDLSKAKNLTAQTRSPLFPSNPDIVAGTEAGCCNFKDIDVGFAIIERTITTTDRIALDRKLLPITSCEEANKDDSVIMIDSTDRSSRTLPVEEDFLLRSLCEMDASINHPKLISLCELAASPSYCRQETKNSTHNIDNIHFSDEKKIGSKGNISKGRANTIAEKKSKKTISKKMQMGSEGLNKRVTRNTTRMADQMEHPKVSDINSRDIHIIETVHAETNTMKAMDILDEPEERQSRNQGASSEKTEPVSKKNTFTTKKAKNASESDEDLMQHSEDASDDNNMKHASISVKQDDVFIERKRTLKPRDTVKESKLGILRKDEKSKQQSQAGKQNSAYNTKARITRATNKSRNDEEKIVNSDMKLTQQSVVSIENDVPKVEKKPDKPTIDCPKRTRNIESGYKKKQSKRETTMQKDTSLQKLVSGTSKRKTKNESKKVIGKHLGVDASSRNLRKRKDRDNMNNHMTISDGENRSELNETFVQLSDAVMEMKTNSDTENLGEMDESLHIEGTDFAGRTKSLRRNNRKRQENRKEKIAEQKRLQKAKNNTEVKEIEEDDGTNDEPNEKISKTDSSRFTEAKINVTEKTENPDKNDISMFIETEQNERQDESKILDKPQATNCQKRSRARKMTAKQRKKREKRKNLTTLKSNSHQDQINSQTIEDKKFTNMKSRQDDKDDHVDQDGCDRLETTQIYKVAEVNVSDATKSDDKKKMFDDLVTSGEEQLQETFSKTAEIVLRQKENLKTMQMVPTQTQNGEEDKKEDEKYIRSEEDIEDKPTDINSNRINNENANRKLRNYSSARENKLEIVPRRITRQRKIERRDVEKTENQCGALFEMPKCSKTDVPVSIDKNVAERNTSCQIDAGTEENRTNAACDLQNKVENEKNDIMRNHQEEITKQNSTGEKTDNELQDQADGLINKEVTDNNAETVRNNKPVQGRRIKMEKNLEKKSTRKAAKENILKKEDENSFKQPLIADKQSTKKKPLEKRNANAPQNISQISVKKRRTLFNKQNSSLMSIGFQMQDTTLNSTSHRTIPVHSTFMPQTLQNFLKSFVAPKIKKKSS